MANFISIEIEVNGIVSRTMYEMSDDLDMPDILIRNLVTRAVFNAAREACDEFEEEHRKVILKRYAEQGIDADMAAQIEGW